MYCHIYYRQNLFQLFYEFHCFLLVVKLKYAVYKTVQIELRSNNVFGRFSTNLVDDEAKIHHVVKELARRHLQVIPVLSNLDSPAI